MITTLAPAEWPRPRGYANGMTVGGPGRLIVLAGQVGSNANGVFETEVFAGQCGQVFRNIARLLREAGAGPEHVMKLTWFVTRKDEYMAEGREIGAAWREVFGRHFPAMSVIFVSALVEDRAKVEIEATAFLPASPAASLRPAGAQRTIAAVAAPQIGRPFRLSPWHFRTGEAGFTRNTPAAAGGWISNGNGSRIF